MVVDCIDEFNSVIHYIEDADKCLLIPIYTDSKLHVSINKLCCIYIYTSDNVERMIPIHHTEQIRGFSEHIQRLLDLSGIIVYDKKDWVQTGGNRDVLDLKSMWWYVYEEAYEESYYVTNAHNFYWRRHNKLQHVNSIIPIMSHIAMCQKIQKYSWPMIMNWTPTESYIKFNDIFPSTFADIERSGISVSSNFKMIDIATDNIVYSKYNYFTATGRPSNAYRGFNFAAIDKSDGTRDTIIPKNDVLVEMDFDSYHVRLIADHVNYKFPKDISVHEYLGNYYFGKSVITTDERDESKKITFRQLYGGIEKEFLQIPFFKTVQDFIYKLKREYDKNGYLITALLKRKLLVPNSKINTIFNYFIQSLEAESTAIKIKQVNEYLEDKKSSVILYTYDSLLFDFELQEVKQHILKLRSILEGDNYPVNIKYGADYGHLIQV